MSKCFILAGIACLSVVSPCIVANASEGDDEWEEVVVRRKKKRSKTPKSAQVQVAAPAASVVMPAAVIMPTTVVALPQAVPAAPAVPAVDEAAEEPPPPPEPPEADAAEPRRLVRYFCKAWKDKDYERMWWAMSPQYRKKVSLKKFKKIFEGDAESNGGLKDENILEEGKTRKGNNCVKTELIFKFPRARHRIVLAEVERQTGGAFRVVDSPFIPLDLEDL